MVLNINLSFIDFFIIQFITAIDNIRLKNIFYSNIQNCLPLAVVIWQNTTLKVSGRCRLFSERSRSRKVLLLSISKFFYCCHSDIDFT